MKATRAHGIAASVLAAALMLAGCGGAPQSTTEKSADTVTEKTEQTQTDQTKTETTKTDTTAQSTDAQANKDTTQTQSAPATNETAQTTNSSQPAYIGDAAAITAALNQAGLTEADVFDLKCELDTDDAVVHYDVDFKSGNLEYDCDINATTGEVITFNS